MKNQVRQVKKQEQNRQILHGNYGGINGRNLQLDWYGIWVYKTEFNTLRNYLGESRTFQIFVKNYMICLFFVLAPIGMVIQIVKNVVIYPHSSRTAYMPQFWFYMLYLLFVTGIYGVFVQRYRSQQLDYIKNFVQQSPVQQLVTQYKGPYMRDIINDNANTYNEKFRDGRDSLKTYLVILIFGCIIGSQIGFYYGVRAIIVGISYRIPEFDTSMFYMIRPIQLIGYSIYFVTNMGLYKYIIVPLSRYLTKLENRATVNEERNSENFKLYVFLITIQLIGPIDLVFIQYVMKTSCSADWCFKQLESYAYCRYILVLGVVVVEGGIMLVRFVNKSVQRNCQDSDNSNKYTQLNYSRRLTLFLQYIYNQSKKQQCKDVTLISQTVSLIQFTNFLTVFPLGSMISFLSMLLVYNIQKISILENKQRPICKAEEFGKYRKIIIGIGHWMLFFNFSQMFITLEWLEYLFQDFVLFVLPSPSVYSIMTLKYGVILFFMGLYQFVMYAIIRLVRKYQSVIDKRKWKMLQKYGIKHMNSGTGIELKLPKPIESISRTYNKIKIKNYKDKKDNRITEEEKDKWGGEEYATEYQLKIGEKGKREGVIEE